jgi:hypothetical protein
MSIVNLDREGALQLARDAISRHPNNTEAALDCFIGMTGALWGKCGLTDKELDDIWRTARGEQNIQIVEEWVAKGYVEKSIRNGEVSYRMTPLGAKALTAKPYP